MKWLLLVVLWQADLNPTSTEIREPRGVASATFDNYDACMLAAARWRAMSRPTTAVPDVPPSRFMSYACVASDTGASP